MWVFWRAPGVSGIVDVLLGLLDVLEAEARSLRMGFLRVVSALFVLAVAALLLLGALLVLLWAAFLWLSSLVVPPLAALLVSLLALLLAAALWWRARSMLR